MPTLNRKLTGRRQTEDANRLEPTPEDFTRLERLLNRPWSPFRKMDAQELSKLGQSFELLEYQAGDIIMQKGVMGRHLYLLEDGSVELFNVKYGQQPVIVTTIDVDKDHVNQVLGKFNDRLFGLTSLRLAVEQPVGARAALDKGPCRVWRMSADAYDISLQNREEIKQMFAKYASVNMPKSPHGSISDVRLSKKMTQEDFFNAIIESDPDLQNGGGKQSLETERSLKTMFSIADGDMNDPTGLLSFPEFAALFDLLDHNYSHYDIAFRAFDLNRTGFVTRSNFERGIQRRILRKRKTNTISTKIPTPTTELGAGSEKSGGSKLAEGYRTIMGRSKVGEGAESAEGAATAVEKEFMFSPKADLVRRYFKDRKESVPVNTASDGGSSSGGSNTVHKSTNRPLNFGEFSEFFNDLSQEIAAQAFENVADENNCITFEEAVPLIQMVAPAHTKDYMIKNLTQLLAVYGDSKISYPAFRAFTCLLGKIPYLEAAIYRQCRRTGRKISRSEFAGATMIEGTDWTVSDELTPLQFQIMWDVMSRARGGEIGPDDLVTKFKWKGTMADIGQEVSGGRFGWYGWVVVVVFF